MEIATRKVFDVLIVDLNGRLDSRSAGDASDRLVKVVQGGDKQVVMNLHKLDYVSSAGLRVILQAAKLLQGQGGALRLCCANDAVREVLVTSGFNSLVKLYASEKEAFASLQS